MDQQRRPALSLLLTSPRVAPGLLSAAAWTALHEADHVLAADPSAPVPAALAASGVRVAQVAPGQRHTPAQLARHLLELAGADRHVVWVGSGDGDPGLAEALAVELPEGEGAPTLELLVGSWDTPGARLLDAVAVMDRLRSPGGCPWDAQQTHASLTPYLIEEAYEAAEVLDRLDDGQVDRQEAVDELGDVLLQVLFHARVAADHDEDPFDVDDVAATLVAKLVRRHPHVFADGDASTPEAVEAAWDRIKAAENAGKAGRTHVLDGIPTGMPPLERAAKVASRLGRAGQREELDTWLADRRADAPGAALLAAVLGLHDAGQDPSAALRATLRDLELGLRDQSDAPRPGPIG